MPSPLGHALGGLAAGWLIAGSPPAPSGSPTTNDAAPPALRDRPLLKRLALFGALGMLPDIDFLFRMHSMYTHSLGAAALVGVAAGVVNGWGDLRFAFGAAAAYATHVLLDWLGSDTSPPIGIMALWPVSDRFYQSDLHWFMAISRRYWLPGFWTHNLAAVFWEVVVLGPIVLTVRWMRTRR